MALATPPIEMRPVSSPATSIYSRSHNSLALDVAAHEDLKAELMLNYLHQRQFEKAWYDPTAESEQGVILKRRKGDFIAKPASLSQEKGELYAQICRLNANSAMTVRTEVIITLLQRIPLINTSMLGIQILPNILALGQCRKRQLAALIQEPPLLVVWHEDPKLLTKKAEDVQSQIFHYACSDHHCLPFEKQHDCHPARIGSAIGEGDFPIDEERDAEEKSRKLMLYQAFLTACAAAILFFCVSVGASKLAVEIAVDKTYLRLVLLIFIPPQLWVGWFFFQSIVNGVTQLLGPVNQMENNSTCFSAVRSRRLTPQNLPHVTIQCPVYKEGLWSVIDPTMASVQATIATYEMQGGSANIFVNDDGMRVISTEDADNRRIYYEEHNIGWVARPKHNTDPANEKETFFIRPGKFKKASNMNYALNVSMKVEEKLSSYVRGSTWTQNEESIAYDISLARTIKEDNGLTWAEGDIRIGDYILIIDSDTRLPADCLIDLVSEMEASPELAIIQVSSGVMNVTTSFFEKGITYFTNLVYTAIQYAAANGDIACFVGHNAMIRWSSLQDVQFKDGQTSKYWSETTVSEDFDLALRLQMAGYDLRLCAYFKGGFKEGVSLTVYDEIARWEKYAYGCSELVFHPLAKWLTKGPFTSLFRIFIRSKMSLMAKLTIMSYIATYYALASTWFLTLGNYFLIGWANGYLDQYYFNSFNVFFSVVVVFQGLGTVALAVLRYRLSERSLLNALTENISWLPLITIFLGGISIHIFQAIAAHMLSIDMTWGSTSKEEVKTTFFREMPTVFWRFKFTFVYCATLVGVIITMAGIGPLGAMIPPPWRITEFVAIFPLAITIAFHLLMPLVLNPGLMQFSF